MMRILITLLAITILFSCSSGKEDNNSETTSVDFKTLDTSIYFSGYWLSEDYYDSIRNFKSPKDIQYGSNFIDIPGRTREAVNMIYNFHEGGPVLKIYKNKNDFELWEVQDDSLIQLFNKIQIISPEKIKVGDKNYVKINTARSENEYLILEELLFKGVYTTKDGKTVEFSNDRQINGLDKFHYYSPIIDYFDAGLQIDQVGLGNSKNNLEYFGFKFKGDTLELYNLKCLTYDSMEKRCVEVDYGKMVYKMWKRNK